MYLTVQDIVRETPDSVSVIFKNSSLFKKVKYKAGQFLTLNIPINDRIEKRAYSFSSSPTSDKFLRITVKKVDKGLVSNFVCDHLKIGQKIKVEKAQGSFYIEPVATASHQYVLFAGGSGITPIFSIIKTILEKEPLSKMLLVYANKDIENVIFKRALEELEQSNPDRLQVEHILEKTQSPSDRITEGLFNYIFFSHINKKYQLDLDAIKVMMCGPSGYMDEVKKVITDFGVDVNHIKYELFKSSAVAPTAAKDLVSQIVVHQSGTNQSFEIKGDKSILQGALKNKVDIPYSCRSGMCSTCKAKCISGEVKMIDGHFLSEEEVADGNILTCVSFPVTEHVEIVL